MPYRLLLIVYESKSVRVLNMVISGTAFSLRKSWFVIFLMGSISLTRSRWDHSKIISHQPKLILSVKKSDLRFHKKKIWKFYQRFLKIFAYPIFVTKWLYNGGQYVQHRRRFVFGFGTIWRLWKSAMRKLFIWKTFWWVNRLLYNQYALYSLMQVIRSHCIHFKILKSSDLILIRPQFSREWKIFDLKLLRTFYELETIQKLN